MSPTIKISKKSWALFFNRINITFDQTSADKELVGFNLQLSDLEKIGLSSKQVMSVLHTTFLLSNPYIHIDSQ